jgi:hypothetical protein
MLARRSYILNGMLCGILLAGITFLAAGQENVRSASNHAAGLKPAVQTSPVAASAQASVVKQKRFGTGNNKIKSYKNLPAFQTPLQNKPSYGASAVQSKKKQWSSAVTVPSSHPQPIAPVSNAIWAETKDAAPEKGNTFTSTAMHLGLSVVAALFGTAAVLGLVAAYSKKRKQVSSYIGFRTAVLPNSQVIRRGEETAIRSEVRQKEYAPAAEGEMNSSDGEERRARNDYELSLALQELKLQQRISDVVTMKKSVKSKKKQIGTAKKIGAGIGEFELAARLAKMQGRSMSKVMS